METNQINQIVVEEEVVEKSNISNVSSIIIQEQSSIKTVKTKNGYIDFYKIGNHPELSSYYISKDGQIYSTKQSYHPILSSHIINGYSVITLEDSVYSINRLVAETFILNINNLPIVDHIDNNKLNNNVNNLQWLTQKDNLLKVDTDMSHPRQIIQRDMNGNVIKIFNSVTEASEELNISRSAVSKAVNKINASCQGFIFDFVDEKHNHALVDISEAIKIEGYDNYYVFKDGKVYNTQRKNYVNPIPMDSGYSYVTLCKNGKKKNMRIHILVAKAFIPNPEDKKTVNHKNYQTSDNRLDNLEWMTMKEQREHQSMRYKTNNN